MLECSRLDEERKQKVIENMIRVYLPSYTVDYFKLVYNMRLLNVLNYTLLIEI